MDIMTKGTRPAPEGAAQQPGPDEGPGELARKLGRLFLLHPHDGKAYTAADVAGAINKRAGKNIISATYVWQLRVGRADNPTVNRLKALADFFHVPASYLLGGDDELDRRTEAELDDLELMQHHRVRQVAYQMAALADDVQAAVQDLALRIAELPEEGREVMLKVLAGLEDASKLAARLSGKDQERV
jgi:transcriptional regulator with XRE-family HTH domain